MAPVELYSDLYWELIGVHARMMVSHKQNVHRIYPSWHVLATYDNGKYTFDFSRFDREVELFDAAGETPLKRIEGGHLAWRSGAWENRSMSRFCFRTTRKPGNTRGRPLPIRWKTDCAG